LSALVGERIERYPVSGEINRSVADAQGVQARVQEHFARDAVAVTHLDGLSMDMGAWRFNLRSSNTEALLRLNVESRGDRALMERKRDEVLALVW
jgi:phosphomannomutase